MGVGMRKKYIQLTQELTDKDDRIVTLLGEIGVFSFKPTKDKHPDRVINMGICEQSIISVAAGMASEGLIPFVHTIAPFIVERGYEQLKDDFGYQKLGGNFIGIGASYDDGGLGSTHYCPADVPALKAIPGFQIFVPGTENEAEQLIRDQYANGKPNYFRLSTQANAEDHPVEAGKATVIKRGTQACVVAVGPTLDMVVEAAEGLDVAILYYTTVEPFDKETLRQECSTGKVLLCEPYYYGALTTDVIEAFSGKAVQVATVGVPHKFLTSYGTRDEIDKDVGLSSENIRAALLRLIEA